ncbi:MAG: bifunctional tetrahydrofolate synthase/dihydrofolate synthase [Thiogranum sp.]|nr:bifunctional tetrahydrofolate synthase/dihydrofolate synthase [Thiogranum sp.]
MGSQNPRFNSLDQWLQWQETLHPSAIDLGLERVERVAERLDCRNPGSLAITVGGTNGKGSALAMLEAILLRAGYRVGCYTSPHLFLYNERLRLQGEPVPDATLCDAFDRVDKARGDISLTYFEFGTLAALDIMRQEQPDVALLEVGLGGRLDAVNIVDADAAVLTSIGIDHTDWLGPDRESIGREKAGIFRAGKPAICGDASPPQSVRDEARRLGADLRVLGADYRLQESARGWHWQGRHSRFRDLPRPALAGAHQLANAASVLMVLEMLGEQLPVSREAIESGLKWVALPGRIQKINGRVEQVLDVSHNAQAALALADTLRHMPAAGRTYAVMGMMKDKNVQSFVSALQAEIAGWYAVGLEPERASKPQQLAADIRTVVGAAPVACCASVDEAIDRLRGTVKPGDRILICGSFHTVAEWALRKPEFD